MSTELAAPETHQGLARGDVAGVAALAAMSEEEFAAKLQHLKRGQERIRIIQRELMTEGEDFGNMPGTDKPGLFKAGAEKLGMFYGLKATFEPTVVAGDGVTAPTIRVQMRCLLHVGNADGPVVAEGFGAANSWERKHRYRRAQRACPACGTSGSIRRSKFADKKTGDFGWYCREESCKAGFTSNAPEIVHQEQGDVQNPDPYDLENTLLKMAKKRAHVDATLTATATSGLFSQDLEEGGDEPPAPRGKAAAAPSRAPGEGSEPQAQRGRGPAQPPSRAGEDDVIDTSEGPIQPGAGDRAAAAEAEPNPEYDPRAAARRAIEGYAAAAPAPCPNCSKPAKASKYAKPGKTHYCGNCTISFEPGKPVQP